MPTLLAVSDGIDLAQAVITGVAVVVAGWWAAQRFGDATASRTGVVMEVVDAIWIDSTSIWLRVRIRNERRRPTIIGPYFYTLRSASQASLIPVEDIAGQTDMRWPTEEELESLRENLGSNLLEKTAETELSPLASLERTTLVRINRGPAFTAQTLPPRVFLIDFAIQNVRWPQTRIPLHREKTFGLAAVVLPVVPEQP